jgi:dipeptidyl aminopeptidase/acylaminoacyl peptidase
MITDLKKFQSQRITTLSAVPFTPLLTLSNRGEKLTNPRFSPDGKRIAFTRSDPHDHTKVVVTDNNGSTVLAEFRRNYSDSSLCWSPDGGKLFFTQAEINNGFNVYQDIYSYDISRDSITRLTQGQRLGDVDLSPDGSTFAAVASTRGSQNLALLKNNSLLEDRRVVTDYTRQRVASPRWSPDASQISYTLTDNAGQSSLHLYEVATGKDRTLFTVSHSSAYPIWSRDGSFLIYVSDETGIFNLYAYNLKEGKKYQVSHLLGGALQPDISPNGTAIIFSSYDSRGFSIVQMTFDQGKLSDERGPSLQAARVKSTPTPTGGANAEVTSGLTTQVNSTPYSSLPTLLPHFWLPRISADGSNEPVVGLFTAGTDVLGYNSYSLSADYGNGRKRGYFDFNYQNDYFYPTLFLQAYAAPLLYADLKQRGDYYELNQGVSVGATLPLNFLESRYSISVGYQLRDQSALSALDNRGSFNGVSVFEGRKDNLFAGITFDNVLRYPYSVSSEEGRRVSLQYRRADKGIGSDLNISEYSAGYQEFLRLPGAALKHHILYIRLAGALSDGDLKYAQRAFQLGGIPSDLNPYLRGYPERSLTGNNIAIGTLEYRAPIFSLMRGPGTIPVFAEKIHGAVFIDAGEAWDGIKAFSGSKVKVGAGVEARMDVTLGYWLKATPALGIAHGFGAGGENLVAYMTVYVDL